MIIQFNYYGGKKEGFRESMIQYIDFHLQNKKHWAHIHKYILKEKNWSIQKLKIKIYQNFNKNLPA